MRHRTKHRIIVSSVITLGVVATIGAGLAITPHRAGPSDIYPDSSQTPGMINSDITQSNIDQNICAGPSWSTKSERPPASYTTALKIKQLASNYNGYTNQDTKAYEEDHLISLELGGNPTDVKNLWPEPYSASITDGGAKVKDSVENYLHTQVCAGNLTLAQAQKEISTDWYAVYLTMKPSFGAVSNSVADPDDETI